MNTLKWKMIQGLVLCFGGFYVLNFVENSDPYFHILGFGMTNYKLAGCAVLFGIYVIISPLFNRNKKQDDKNNTNHPIM